MTASSLYLLAYNAAQLAGWSHTVWLLADGDVARAAAVMMYCQVAAAVLETAHAVTGLTRSSLGPLLVQQLGRLVALWLAADAAMTEEASPPSEASERLPSAGDVRVALYASYACAEVIRSLFYTANLAGAGAYAFKWLRYSAFLALYPAGLVAEALTLMRCHEGAGALAAAGSEFYAGLQWVIFVGLFVFPLIGYVLFTNMLRLRSKNLGGAGGARRGKAKKRN